MPHKVRWDKPEFLQPDHPEIQPAWKQWSHWTHLATPRPTCSAVGRKPRAGPQVSSHTWVPSHLRPGRAAPPVQLQGPAESVPRTELRAWSEQPCHWGQRLRGEREEPRWKLETFIKYSFTRLPPLLRAGKKLSKCNLKKLTPIPRMYKAVSCLSTTERLKGGWGGVGGLGTFSPATGP